MPTYEGPVTLSSPLGPDVVVKELPPEEYELFRGIYPFSEIGPPDPARTRVVVAQRALDGRVVGFFFASTCVHLEPLWIDEAYRGRPGILRRFWKEIKRIMVSTGNSCGFAIIADRDHAYVFPQAARMGFRRAPGDLYFINFEEQRGQLPELDPSLKYRLIEDPPAPAPEPEFVPEFEGITHGG